MIEWYSNLCGAIVYRAVLILSLFSSVIFAHEARELCQKLDLQPGTKATIQWERVFKSEERQKKLGIDRLNDREKALLKAYLIEHAADSAHPMVPGL